MRGVGERNEVYGEDLVSVPEEDGVDDGGFFILADVLLALPDLEGSDLVLVLLALHDELFEGVDDR